MTTNKLIEQESAHVSEMVKLLGLELADAPVKQQPPRPDYYFQLADGKRVAIEVTRAIDQEVEAGNRGARQRLKKMINDALVAEKIPAFVYLSIPIALASALEQDSRDRENQCRSDRSDGS